MFFPTSVATNRQLVLFCARLLVQCVIAWSTPQVGVDELELKCFREADVTNAHSIARNEGQLIALGSGNVLAKLRQTRQRCRPRQWSGFDVRYPPATIA
jgi:hypothetical protein